MPEIKRLSDLQVVAGIGECSYTTAPAWLLPVWMALDDSLWIAESEPDGRGEGKFHGLSEEGIEAYKSENLYHILPQPLSYRDKAALWGNYEDGVVVFHYAPESELIAWLRPIASRAFTTSVERFMDWLRNNHWETSALRGETDYSEILQSIEAGCLRTYRASLGSPLSELPWIFLMEVFRFFGKDRLTQIVLDHLQVIRESERKYLESERVGEII